MDYVLCILCAYVRWRLLESIDYFYVLEVCGGRTWARSEISCWNLISFNSSYVQSIFPVSNREPEEFYSQKWFFIHWKYSSWWIRSYVHQLKCIVMKHQEIFFTCHLDERKKNLSHFLEHQYLSFIFFLRSARMLFISRIFSCRGERCVKFNTFSWCQLPFLTVIFSFTAKKKTLHSFLRSRCNTIWTSCSSTALSTPSSPSPFYRAHVHFFQLK